MTGKQRFQEVQFLDGSSGFCTCGDDTHHIARTGKQRVLEILQQLASDQCDKVNIDKLAITEALDSIEEVMADERKDERRTVANEIGEVHEVQGSHGNWNYDPYMHGMYNGMELCSAIVKGVEPKFKKAPKKWIAEIRGADTKTDAMSTMLPPKTNLTGVDGRVNDGR